MRVYIMVDMEGISGILRNEQVDSSHPEYQSGRQYLTWDVNACVAGCFDGGAKAVTVRDAHGNGCNIIWDQIDPRARLIQQGWEVPARMPLIREHDAVILLGYHAMAGTPNGILEHTMSSGHFQNFWLNGRKAGEIAIDMGIAGDYGKPVIMVSGSQKACDEARAWMSDVVTAAVKKDFDLHGGVMLSKEVAHKLIRDKAAEAVGKARTIKPFKVKRPVLMRLERVSRSRVPVAKAGVRVIDGRTYEVRGKDVESTLLML